MSLKNDTIVKFGYNCKILIKTTDNNSLKIINYCGKSKQTLIITKSK